MKLSLEKLLKEEGASQKVSFLIPESELVDSTTEYEFLDSLKADVTVTNTGNEIRVKGDLRTKLQGSCARCLAPVTLDFQSDFDELFEYTEFSDDDDLDLGEIAIEYLIASLPVKVLCSEDCPGLVPEGHEKEMDPRFEALKKLKLN